MEVQPSDQHRPPMQGGLSGPRSTVGKDDFLMLLTTQLRYQDPLKPMDNQEFTTQLATFNSLDQLINISAKLDAVAAGQLTLSQLQTTSLIGKQVSAQGNRVYLATDGKAAMHYTLTADAARVVVNIKDQNGNLVRTLELRSQKAGEQKVEWDGKDRAGKSLEPGAYTIEVNAFDTSGAVVETTTLIKGVVTGVEMTEGVLLLTVGGLQVPMSAIVKVEEAAR